MTNNNTYVVSVDLGTSSVRACLVDRSLRILKQISKPIALFTDADGKAEQDPNKILRAALECIRDIILWSETENVLPQAVCFSNTTGSLVCLDKHFHPLGMALTYADLRSAQESRDLIYKYRGEIFQNTATPMHASYWLPKFLWLKNQADKSENCHYFCTLKDLLVFTLTGKFVTDYSNAVATGMCDVTEGKWDRRLLKIAGIDIGQLPEIHPTFSIFEINHFRLTTTSQLPGDLKIVLGAIDGVLSSLGAGAFKPGQVTTMIGSSGACRIAANSPLTSLHTMQSWSYPLDDQIWIRGGAMNSGGLVTEWLVENFSANRNTSDASYEEMFSQAAQIKPGAGNLIFLPYLFGERAPIFDESARGVFFGLHNGHHRGHLARAGLEGILMALYSIYEIIHTGKNEPVEIRASGGYLRSELMVQIQADIFGEPINKLANYEGSSVGAAALALKALGVIGSFDEISEYIKIKEQFLPNQENTRFYRGQFSYFKDLYQQLIPLFNNISDIG